MFLRFLNALRDDIRTASNAGNSMFVYLCVTYGSLHPSAQVAEGRKTPADAASTRSRRNCGIDTGRNKVRGGITKDSDEAKNVRDKQ